MPQFLQAQANATLANHQVGYNPDVGVDAYEIMYLDEEDRDGATSLIMDHPFCGLTAGIDTDGQLGQTSFDDDDFALDDHL